mmetsp:Transcript_7639/g.18779  ORF Transcript_7639/g.18779 Transcript_7639/m.18779 type:complete len:245 (-) Transcript_7639:892-1626(-)
MTSSRGKAGGARTSPSAASFTPPTDPPAGTRGPRRAASRPTRARTWTRSTAATRRLRCRSSRRAPPSTSTSFPTSNSGWLSPSPSCTSSSASRRRASPSRRSTRFGGGCSGRPAASTSSSSSTRRARWTTRPCRRSRCRRAVSPSSVPSTMVPSHPSSQATTRSTRTSGRSFARRSPKFSSTPARTSTFLCATGSPPGEFSQGRLTPSPSSQNPTCSWGKGPTVGTAVSACPASRRRRERCSST